MRHPLLIAALLVPYIACAQVPAISPAPLRGLESLVQSAALNNQRLRAYRWIETTTASVAGVPLPSVRALCWYAADGSIVRVPLTAPAVAPSAGPLGPVIITGKIGGVAAEIGAARELDARYLPIRPAELARSLQTRRIQLQRDFNDESAIIMDYEKPDDQLRLNIDPFRKQLRGISVSTYLSTPADSMQISVEFAALDDGTRYPQTTLIEAPGRRLSIRIENSVFTRVAS